MIDSFRSFMGGTARGDNQTRSAYNWSIKLLVFLLIAVIAGQPAGLIPTGRASAQAGGGIYLPMLTAGSPPPPTPTIHIPFLDVENIFNPDNPDIRYNQMALFWFGKLSPAENYNQVRMSYNAQQLFIEVTPIDRRGWYDEVSPSPSEVTNWDAVSIYLHIPANGQYGSRLLRFDSQLSDLHDARAPYHAVFERTASGWKQISSAGFLTNTIYRGNGLNDAINDKGWIGDFVISFSSLGFAGRPPDLSQWKMGMRVSDQNIAPGNATIQQYWPTGFSENDSNTFGVITFGYPSRPTPPNPIAGSVTIQQSATVNVPDGNVGGWTVCGQGIDHWSQWGNQVYDEGVPSMQVNIQNQRDVSEYPCFSRYYITFPLNALPPGKVIVSARLIMNQFGNSGDRSGAGSKPSYIQVFRVKEGWSESTLSWNNSPQVYENYPGTWVDPLPGYPGFPGVPRTWNVTQALVDSLEGDTPHELRLALMSADWAMHSGKYFKASESYTEGVSAPPRLVIEWANP